MRQWWCVLIVRASNQLCWQHWPWEGREALGRGAAHARPAVVLLLLTLNMVAHATSGAFKVHQIHVLCILGLVVWWGAGPRQEGF